MPAPRSNAAKAFADVFYSDEAVKAVFDLAEEITHEPPGVKVLNSSSNTPPEASATHPGNWNALLSLDTGDRCKDRASLAR